MHDSSSTPSRTNRSSAGVAAVAAVAISLCGNLYLSFIETFTIGGPPPAWDWQPVAAVEFRTALAAAPFVLYLGVRAGRLGRVGRAFAVALAAVALDVALGALGVTNVRVVEPAHETASRHRLDRPTSIDGIHLPAGTFVSNDPAGTRVELPAGADGRRVQAPFVIPSPFPDGAPSLDAHRLRLSDDTTFGDVSCEGGADAVLQGGGTAGVECVSTGERFGNVSCAAGHRVRRDFLDPGVDCTLGAPYGRREVRWPAGTEVDTRQSGFDITVGTTPVPVRLFGRALPAGTMLTFEPFEIVLTKHDPRNTDWSGPFELAAGGCPPGRFTRIRVEGPHPFPAPPASLSTGCRTTGNLELPASALTANGRPYPASWAWDVR